MRLLDIVYKLQSGDLCMPLIPHHISLSTKSCSPIHRDSPTDYVSTIRIDILYGDEREAIGQATRKKGGGSGT